MGKKSVVRHVFVFACVERRSEFVYTSRESVAAI